MLLPLIIALLLPGVVSLCPEDDNDLDLDPPEVVIEYGAETLVNCTTTNDDFQEMYWSDGTGQRITEDEETFISWPLSASDWDVKASCTIKLNKSHECSKDLKITVYKRPDRVYLHPLEALVEGRQHQLHCDIINVAPVENLTVRWYANNTLMKTQSFKQTTKTPVNESSTLPVTFRRDDSVVLFRCEAHLDFDSDALVTSDLLFVPVHYAPELNIITNQVLHVQEGDNVTLECEIDANPPPEYQWTSDKGNVWDNTNKLTVTNIRVSADYNCTGTNYLGSTTRQIHINVTNVIMETAASAPVDDTDCSPTLTPSKLAVRFGDPVSIDCNVSASNFEGMGWEATTGGTGLLESSFSTWRVDNLNVWDPKPSCYVTLLNGRQCVSKPSITVYKRPDRVYLHPLEALVEGRQHQLHCDIINVAPVENLTVRWYANNTLMKTQSFNQTTKTPVNESSTLPVTFRRDDSVVLFRCEAHLDFDSDALVTSDLLFVPVHYAPELNIITNQVLKVQEGDNVILECKIDANPPPEYQWTSDKGNVWDNTNKLTVTNIRVSADYNCTGTNYLGSTTRQIHVYVTNVATTTAASAPVDGTVCGSLPVQLTSSMKPMECVTDSDCSPILTPSKLAVRFGDPVSIDCNISASNFKGMGWGATTGGTVYLLSPRLSSWRVDKMEVWDPKPFCYVLLNERRCVSESSITVYKTPDNVLISAFSHKPMVEGTEYPLTCFISSVAPLQNLTVRWYQSSKLLHTDVFYEANGNVTKTPESRAFTLRVVPERGHDGTPFECEVELHLGQEVPKPLTFKSEPYIAVVHFAPTFTQGNHSEDISLGGDVTIGCHAEGNPHPAIHWVYPPADNVKEATWGRQSNITIQQATSTNAGQYICVATNELGKVTRLVTVAIKDEAAQSVLGFSWWYLPLIIISVVIVLFAVTLLHCHRKHGRYSFMTVRTNEEIPLGTKSAAGGIH
ncbi:hemicentin-1-like isoform X2 [Betta splendens]|uniref:Hemicentin-1-like isoform X2 n=1 Tax=Betta splendens TaxID=158456 RepID=A0A6P7N9J8_BETSP|nr:hemicentin-1-like isoform X2 [Betta splendens]